MSLVRGAARHPRRTPASVRGGRSVLFGGNQCGGASIEGLVRFGDCAGGEPTRADGRCTPRHEGGRIRYGHERALSVYGPRAGPVRSVGRDGHRGPPLYVVGTYRASGWGFNEERPRQLD